MKDQKNQINSVQFFSLLFICRAVILLTFNTQLAGGESLLDNVISAGLSLLLSFLFIIPLYFLDKRNAGSDVFDISKRLLGQGAMVAIAIFYGLYYIIINSYYLSFFQLFLTNILEPLTPVWLVGAAIAACAVYAASRGLEGIARAAVLVMTVMILGLFWISAALVPKIEPLNYEPLLFHGPRQVFTGCALFLARSTGFASIALLMPRIKGNKKLGFTAWNFGIYALLAFLIIGMVGAGGDYLKDQLFPVFSASTLAETGVMERLDVVFIVIWIGGLFIKLATDAFQFRYCLSRIVSPIMAVRFFPLAAVAVASLSFIVLNSIQLQKIFYGVSLLLPLTFVAGVGIPAALLFLDLSREKKEKRRRREGTA